MPFLFRTFELGTPRQPGEGLRIGTVRRPPRGIRKEDYRKLDYFDVWLPTLAPSSDLLRRFQGSRGTFNSFSQSYRAEMQKTGPRQTIQLLAELAKTTAISVGCHCSNEGKCHRSILSQLIREAAGLPVIPPFSNSCVYTITHPDTLSQFEQNGGCGFINEAKPWPTAIKLWHEAQASSQGLPIVFADATDCSKLIYSARVSSIVTDDEGTQCQFFQLEPIRGRHSPQDLTLLETGEKIAAGFIRPYALVQTPKFVR